jgi:hypothetical protein
MVSDFFINEKLDSTTIYVNLYGVSEEIIFVHDIETNRFYQLEESNNLHDKNMEGALVKRRIPKSLFEYVVSLTKKYSDKTERRETRW